MSAAGQLIPLDTWAERRFPIRTPHVQTIRRWPEREKVGWARRLGVSPNTLRDALAGRQKNYRSA